jgi:hypothetical protein
VQAKESEVYTPADDWESFFHVLCWVVLRFTKHAPDSARLTYEIYDDCQWYTAHGKIYGGVNNARNINDRLISTDARVLAFFLIC